MAEYIEVKTLKEQDFQDYSDTDVEYAIDHCPRADVVEVVRCCECMCSLKLRTEDNECFFRYCLPYGNFVKDDHYCKLGERRCEE